MQADVVVLGAGIIGVSVALHLALRGRVVALVDRKEPGTETSHGNAGLIQREGVVPYGFPQSVGTIMRHALNRSVDSSYHLDAIPGLASALGRYWWYSRPTNHRRIQLLYEPLIRHSTNEHAALARLAGAEALIRKSGWYKAFRFAGSRDGAFEEAERLGSVFGVGSTRLSGKEFRDREPGIGMDFEGALHWTDAWSVSDPGGLVQAYSTLFERLGGAVLRGDALGLLERRGGWEISTETGPVRARSAVVALGPWSRGLTERLGYRLPLFVKRGYHIHFESVGKGLSTPVMDADAGYMLSPMRNGIRLATGAEFARQDAPQTPVQLARAERLARAFAPIGRVADAKPWMGSRPCTPDMMPVIGRAPQHHELWFALGHAHHGFTLGPITGRIIAELMTNQAPIIDPAPYSPKRFRG